MHTLARAHAIVRTRPLAIVRTWGRVHARATTHLLVDAEMLEVLVAALVAAACGDLVGGVPPLHQCDES